jgi:hypothetical protein
MRARGLVLAALLLGGTGVGVSALPSCGGPPSKTCYGDRVSALGAKDDAGPNVECTTCLQSKNAPNACCDAVGACEDDPANQCVASFQATHRCLVEGGVSEEARCKALLTNDKAKTLYACMRSNCGKECGVPSCDLDPAVVLLGDPTCDRCIGGVCCDTINACYKQRGCKLVVECVAQHCPHTLGPALVALAQAGASAAKDAVCAGQAPALAEGACVQRCFDDFAPSGDAGTDDARCLAFGVLACGADAQCGPRCVRPDAGPYSSGDTWPEDNP